MEVPVEFAVAGLIIRRISPARHGDHLRFDNYFWPNPHPRIRWFSLRGHGSSNQITTRRGHLFDGAVLIPSLDCRPFGALSTPSTIAQHCECRPHSRRCGRSENICLLQENISTSAALPHSPISRAYTYLPRARRVHMRLCMFSINVLHSVRWYFHLWLNGVLRAPSMVAAAAIPTTTTRRTGEKKIKRIISTLP